MNVFLFRKSWMIANFFTFCNFNLSFYNINTSYFFCYCMFNLNSWVNFNEIKFTRFFIKQKFNSSCTKIFNLFCNFNSSVTNFFSSFIFKKMCRCSFNNLLMPSLKRTISFKKMYDISVFVT